MQRLLFACAVVAVGTVAGTSRAGLIEYGDFAANTVDFLDVNEFSSTDPGPLYGVPITSGDSLLFNNMLFATAAAGAGGADTSIGILNTTITAHDGEVIDALSFNETGSYSLSGLVNDAFASVSAAYIITVLEVDGMSIDPVGIDTLMQFNPSDGDFSISEDGAGADLWEGNLDVDVNAMLASMGIFGHATKVAVTITNTLSALSQDSTTASISKKSLQITVVPAPPAALLLLGGFAVRRRRRA